MSDGKTETTAVDELRKILEAINSAEWVRHGATGEEVKRICFTPIAIARIRNVIGISA